MFEYIETTLMKEAPLVLSDYPWYQAKMFGTFALGGGGINLAYLEKDLTIRSPRYIDEKGRSSIRRMPSEREINSFLFKYCEECQQAGTPWNEATFIMDREGNIEHSFVMNWQRVFQQKIDSIHTAASGLAERVYEHLSNILPDDTTWEAGSATLAVREGEVAASYSITVGGVTQTQLLKLDKSDRKMWLDYYNWVDSCELKGHFPAWNTIQIELPFEESDFYRDDCIRYEVQ